MTLYILSALLFATLSTAIFIYNRRLAGEVRRNRYSLALSRSLADIAQAISESNGLDDLYTRVAELIKTTLCAEDLYIAIHDDEGDFFTLPFFEDKLTQRPLVMDDPRSFTNYVFRTGKPVMLSAEEIRQMIADPECPVWIADDIVSKQYIAVPLDAGDTRVGVIAFQSYSDENQFTESDLHFVVTVSRQIGEAILRIRALQEIRESRQRQQLILDADPSAIFLLDCDGVIIDCNRKACKYTMMNPVEIEGCRLTHFLLGSDGSEFNPISDTSQKEEGSFSCCFKRETCKITEVEGLISSFSEGQELMHFVSIRDVTEKSILRQEAIRNERIESIGLLAGGIAHDFNNILTGIMGSLSLMQSKDFSPEKKLALIRGAENATARARELTGQLLTFSEGGAPVKESVRTEELLEEVAVFSLRGSSVLLDLQVEDDILNMNVDYQQFSQVLGNITVNARQAMNDSGRLLITAYNIMKEQGSFVRITFEDTGPGIDEGVIEHIFDPYFTTNESGHGLGLATCFSIVQRHGGVISASNSRTSGARFILDVPASRESASSTPEDEIHKFLPKSGKVLILDDDKTVAETAELMLDFLGYRSDIVTEGKAVVQKYRDEVDRGEPYCAVIMDLTIPGGMGGAEAVKQLLDAYPFAVVIVSSGYSRNDVMANYTDYGFRGVLPKPYTLSELGEALQSAFKC